MFACLHWLHPLSCCLTYYILVFKQELFFQSWVPLCLFEYMSYYQSAQFYVSSAEMSRTVYTPTLQDSMDGTGENYAKWSKPAGKRQIPYDLTYKWTLINKINKQAKYNQRHWNKEQTDSNQREGGRAITGERRGRIIKEHV